MRSTSESVKPSSAIPATAVAIAWKAWAKKCSLGLDDSPVVAQSPPKDLGVVSLFELGWQSRPQGTSVSVE